MAFSTRSNLFLLTLLLFSTQINARDSYYSFNKFQRETSKDQNPNGLQPNEQDDQNPTFIPESENGYGLYGQDKTYNEELSNNKHEENVNYEDSFSTPSLSQTQEPYNNYGDNNKEMSYDENSNGYGTEKREKEAYYSNNIGRQGMSDTRFMANGNYYFDLDDERNHGRFYQKQYDNYKPTGYNEKDVRFKNPYNSKNMMNEQSEKFGEEQGDQFTP